MVAEIKGSGTQNVSQAAVPVEQANRPVAGPAPVDAARPAAGSDVVTLTDLASRLQSLGEAVEQVPVVDKTKVATLREAIDNGTYRVDPRQVAEKMSALEGLLDGASKA